MPETTKSLEIVQGSLVLRIEKDDENNLSFSMWTTHDELSAICRVLNSEDSLIVRAFIGGLK